MQSSYKPIKSTSNVKEIKITDEFGMVANYKVDFSTYIEPEAYDPEHCEWCKKGIPEIVTEFNITLKDMSKTKQALSREDIKTIMKTKNIIPPTLVYDHFLLGFVYADSSDPNNHRWWIDFRNNKDQSIYNCWGDKIKINCPYTTHSWFENEFHHGRYRFSSGDVEAIKEPRPGELVILGKLKKECKPIKNVCSIQHLPDKAHTLRFRYNTREDLWFCDILDKKDKSLGQISCKSLICDAITYGNVINVGDRPKVNTRINVTDISDIAIAINSLIIRGK